jgi:chromosome partitioning protein
MKTIAFFNNKGGVGKTSLVYHLAWMFSELGHKLVVADLDPQANLTSMFLPEDDLVKLWNDNSQQSIYTILEPSIKGTGDISAPMLSIINEYISLIPGDLRLSGFEDQLSESWPKCSDGIEVAFRKTAAFYRTIDTATKQTGAHYAFIDLGPNLGAINRAALISADYIVVPLGPDLFSLQGLKNMGPTVRLWRSQWSDRKGKCENSDIILPGGGIDPLGYVMMRHSIRNDRPVKSYARWIARMPEEYRHSILDAPPSAGEVSYDDDDNRLATLKDYRSLMPMAQEARKPMFFLEGPDGAIGSHQRAAEQCYADFKALAEHIIERVVL